MVDGNEQLRDEAVETLAQEIAGLQSQGEQSTSVALEVRRQFQDLDSETVVRSAGAMLVRFASTGREIMPATVTAAREATLHFDDEHQFPALVALTGLTSAGEFRSGDTVGPEELGAIESYLEVAGRYHLQTYDQEQLREVFELPENLKGLELTLALTRRLEDTELTPEHLLEIGAISEAVYQDIKEEEEALEASEYELQSDEEIDDILDDYDDDDDDSSDDDVDDLDVML